MIRFHTSGAARVRRSCVVQIAGVALACANAPVLVAQRDTTLAHHDTTQLSAVTVIGSRSDLAEERARVLRVAGGIAIVSGAELRATRQANLHDVLQFTPGVYIQPRFGVADESQVSIRGSGLRNNFH